MQYVVATMSFVRTITFLNEKVWAILISELQGQDVGGGLGIPISSCSFLGKNITLHRIVVGKRPHTRFLYANQIILIQAGVIKLFPWLGDF